MKIILSFLLLFQLMGCQPDKGESVTQLNPPKGKHSSHVQSLIDKNDQIQIDFAQRIILVNTATDQRIAFKDFLVRSRRLLILILDQPKSVKHINDLELMTLELDDFPLAIQDLSYVAPYKKGLKDLVKMLYTSVEEEAKNYIVNFNFNKVNIDKLIRTKDPDAADFLPGTNDAGRSYISPKSHNPAKTGKTALITPAFQLGSLNYGIQFEYFVRFYSSAARSERLIKFFVGEDTENVKDVRWLDLNIEIAADASGWGVPPVISPVKLIPINNKKVRIKIEYISDAAREFTQAFNLYRFEIKEAKE